MFEGSLHKEGVVFGCLCAFIAFPIGLFVSYGLSTEFPYANPLEAILITVLCVATVFISAAITWNKLVRKPNKYSPFRGFSVGFLAAYIMLIMTFVSLFVLGAVQHTMEGGFESILSAIISAVLKALIMVAGSIFFLPWYIVPVLMGVGGMFYIKHLGNTGHNS